MREAGTDSGIGGISYTKARVKGRPMPKAFAAAFVLLLTAASPLAAASPEVKTEEQKTLYALGLALSQSLSTFALSDKELELVKDGLSDGVLVREHKVEVQPYMPKIQEFQKSRMAAAATIEKKSGEVYLAKAAAEKGATKTQSGIVITTIKPGTGASPGATDKVKVHYQGTLTDGTVFDSSVQRGEPVTFALNQVIKCWTEGVQTMKIGGKTKLVCPADRAYGDRGAPPRIKPGATRVFEVELIDIVK